MLMVLVVRVADPNIFQADARDADLPIAGPKKFTADARGASQLFVPNPNISKLMLLVLT